MKLSLENKLFLILSSGLLTVITGCYLGWFGLPSIVNAQITKYKRLNNNESLKDFKILPVPLNFKVYFFNVSNPEEITQGAVPVLKEVGPYVYEEYITNQILESNYTNRLKYIKHTLFKYSQEKSQGRKESDIVTIINVPLLGIALFLERNMPLAIDVLEDALPALFPGKNKLFLTATVRDLLFDGYPIRCTEHSEIFCSALKAKSLEAVKYDQATNSFLFAFFRRNNGTKGPFEIDRGLKEIRNVGRILSYKGDSVLNTWVPNTTCDALVGSDAALIGPFIPTHEPLLIFEPDVCLSVTADYVGETNYLGIPASKYVGSRLNFAEENTNCRCPRDDYSDPESLPECLMPGIIDLTPCQGAPILVSQPHFFQGDDHLAFANFIRPVADKHQTFTILDRLTGVPVYGEKRVQLNILLKPIEDVSVLENVTQIVFPALWVEEGVKLNATILQDLIKIYSLLSIFNIAKWVLLGIGIILIATGIGYYFYKKHGSVSSENESNHHDSVLFSKVTRNFYSTNPSSLPAKQFSSDSHVRERYSNTIDGDNYVMTLSSKLYPADVDVRHVQRNSYIYPS